MRISIEDAKNNFPKAYPKTGVTMKLIIKADPVNFTFVKDFLICFKSIDKNKTYKSKIKKISIAPDDTFPNGVNVPKTSPNTDAIMMITG